MKRDPMEGKSVSGETAKVNKTGVSSFLLFLIFSCIGNTAFAIDASAIEEVMRKYQNKYHYVAVVNSFGVKYLTWSQLHCSPAPSYPINFYGEITENQADILVNDIVNKFYSSSPYSYSNISGYFLEKLPEGDESYQTVIVTRPNSEDSWQDRLAQVNSDIDKLIYYRVYVSTTDPIYRSGSGYDYDTFTGTHCVDWQKVTPVASFENAESEAESNWYGSTSSCGGAGIATYSYHSYSKHSHECDPMEYYDSHYYSAYVRSTNVKLEANLASHTGTAQCYLKLTSSHYCYQSTITAEDGIASDAPVVVETDPNEPFKFYAWTSATVGQAWTSGYLFEPNSVPDISSPSRRISEDENGNYTEVNQTAWGYGDAIVVVQPDFDSETDLVLTYSSPTELVYKTKDKHIVYSANEGCGHSSGETVRGRIIINGYIPDVSMKLEVKLNHAFSDKVAQLSIQPYSGGSYQTIVSDDTERVYCFTPQRDDPNDVWHVPFKLSAKTNKGSISFSIATVYSDIPDPNEPRVKTYRGEGENVSFKIENNGYECCNRKEGLVDLSYPQVSKHKNSDIEIYFQDIDQSYIWGSGSFSNPPYSSYGKTCSFLDMSIAVHDPNGTAIDEYIKLSQTDGGNMLIYSIGSGWIAENTDASATFIEEQYADGTPVKYASYDGSGRLDKICDAADSTNFYRQFYYGDTGNPNRITSYTDYAGQVSRTYTLVYDVTSGRLAGTIGGTGSGCSSCALSGSNRLYYYDDYGNLLTITDIEDTVINEHEYDTQHRLTNTWLGAKTDAIPVQEIVYSSDADAFGGSEIQDVYDYTTSSDARLTRNILDADRRVITQITFDTLNLDGSAATDPNTAIALGGHVTTYEYGYSGSTLESISTKSPAFNEGSTFAYYKNTLNNGSSNYEDTVLVSVDPDGIDDDIETMLSRNVYSNNQLTASYDARGWQDSKYTSYGYDSYNRLSFRYGPSVTQLNGELTNLRYDYTFYPGGRTKTETVSNNNQTATRVIATYFYNYIGHPTGMETRDYYGNLLSTAHTKTNGFGETIYSIDNSGIAKGKEYDSHGKLISEFVFADPNDTALFDGDDPNALLEDISSVYTSLEVASQTRYVYNDLGQIYQTKVAVADDVFTYDTPDSWYITQFGYDDYGRKTSQIEDVGGLALTTTYAFNNQGQVTKTIYPDSHWNKQVRNGRGLVVKAIDGHGPENTEPNDFVIRETVYDADGNVIKESISGDVTGSYVLDEMGGIWRAYQGDWETEYCDYTEYTRDFDGRVIDQNSIDVDAYGNETIIQEIHNRYNARGELTVQRTLDDPDTGEDDLLDRVQLFSYDHQGRRVETVTKADGNSSIYTDPYEDEVAYEAGDKIEQNWYDLAGNLEYTFRFEYVGDSATSYDLPFDDVDNAFRYAKDSREVYVTGYIYINGRLAYKDILKGFDEDDPYFYNWSYPFAGLLWHPAQELEYDDAGRTVKTIDADDNFKVFAYNSRNQQTEQTLWQGKPILRLSDGSYDPNTFDPYPIRRSLTAYDAAGRKSRSVVLLDPNEAVGIDEVNMQWDKITDFVYNADGQLYRQKELIEQNGVNSTFALTELTYDDHGRVDQILYGQLDETDVFGSIWETKTPLKTIGYQYNTKGQKTVQTITEVNTSDSTTANFSTYFDYDSQGRLDEIQNATGVIYACNYDALGRKTEETDAVGKVTQHDYYTTGELYQKTENPTGLDRQTIYGRDRFGRQISIASGSDQTDYAYSYLDLITDVNYPGGDSVSFGYDMLGLATRRTVTKDSQSMTTHYKRDALGRVCYKQYTGETNWTEPNSLLPFDEILYNAAGQKEIIAYMSNGNDLELNIYSYNGFGNLTGAGETSGDFSSSVSYGYDQRGLVKSVTYPNEKSVAYTRDALGRIDSVTYDGKRLVDYYYQGDIVVNKQMAAADIEYEATVDTLGRITAETFSDISTSTSFLTNSYDYTSYSNRLDERNDIDYSFDGLGKLTAEDTTSYTSDILGNPTNASDDGLIYTLDNEDRIVDVDDVSGDVASYEYDRLGRRDSKTVDGTTMHFVYDLYGNIIAEYEDGDWARDYIYGAKGEAVYMQFPQTAAMDTAFSNFVSFVEAWLCNPYCTQNDLVWDVNDDDQINLIDWSENVEYFEGAFTSNGRYLLTDFRNSVVGKVNFDGSVDEIAYTAFGYPTVAQGVDLEGLTILWNGYYYDYETGNYYLRNRYYSPVERRFLTDDPHGINPDGNWNNPFFVFKQYIDGFGLQVYAQGDPVNNRDDWGLMIWNPGWPVPGIDYPNPVTNPEWYHPSPPSSPSGISRLPSFSGIIGYSGSLAWYIPFPPPASAGGGYVQLSAEVRKGTCCCTKTGQKKNYTKWSGSLTGGVYAGTPGVKARPTLPIVENLKKCPKTEKLTCKGTITASARIAVLMGNCSYTWGSGWSCTGGIRLWNSADVRITFGGGMVCSRTDL